MRAVLQTIIDLQGRLTKLNPDNFIGKITLLCAITINIHENNLRINLNDAEEIALFENIQSHNSQIRDYLNNLSVGIIKTQLQLLLLLNAESLFAFVPSNAPYALKAIITYRKLRISEYLSNGFSSEESLTHSEKVYVINEILLPIDRIKFIACGVQNNFVATLEKIGLPEKEIGAIKAIAKNPNNEHTNYGLLLRAIKQFPRNYALIYENLNKIKISRDDKPLLKLVLNIPDTNLFIIFINTLSTNQLLHREIAKLSTIEREALAINLCNLGYSSIVKEIFNRLPAEQRDIYKPVYNIWIAQPKINMHFGVQDQPQQINPTYKRGTSSYSHLLHNRSSVFFKPVTSTQPNHTTQTTSHETNTQSKLQEKPSIPSIIRV